jgi:hypothetical protein
MNCEETTGLLSDRLKGLVAPDDERRLEAHLAGCAACREEAAAVDALWAELGAVDDDVPQARMRARFHAALAAYEERTRTSGFDRFVERFWPERPAFQLACAMALLAVGLVAGRALPTSADAGTGPATAATAPPQSPQSAQSAQSAQLPTQAEIAALREDLRTVSLALLDHQSASERLLGVAWSRRTAAYAPVTDALLDVAQNDSNVNVRLAAVEALSGWLDRPEIGAALTDALGSEREPLMQVTLAGVLLANGVSGSAAAVERLAGQDDVDPSVRDYLRAALEEMQAAPRADTL